jgi:hypothetical protein
MVKLIIQKKNHTHTHKKKNNKKHQVEEQQKVQSSGESFEVVP